MTPEEAFRRAWGREPARSEIERIHRLKTAFQIDDNDAFVTIAMVLEFYDGHFKVYPERCASAAAAAVRQWLQSPEGAAVLQRMLSKFRPSYAVPSNTRKLPHESTARAPASFPVLLGVFVAGAVTGGAAAALALAGFSTVAIGRLAAWLIVPVVAAYVGAWGWQLARDCNRPSHHRWGGWAALIAACASIAVWLVLVGR
jgi:hypothetical protein